jgi:hypothetical protein
MILPSKLQFYSYMIHAFSQESPQVFRQMPISDKPLRSNLASYYNAGTVTYPEKSLCVVLNRCLIFKF